jgi:uncharacterized repeat protein (TIGR03803 family)
MKPTGLTHALFTYSLLKASVAALALTLVSAPSGWAGSKYEVLHEFGDGSDGMVPGFGLTFDLKGNLYGVTYQGGPGCKSNRYCGTVFQLARQTNGTWMEKILYNFTTRSEGYGPNGGVTFDNKGDLLGAVAGGPNGTSALYQLAPGSKGLSLIYDAGAELNVVLDKADNIYGYLGSGMYGAGAISELLHGSDGWTLDTLYSFCNPQTCPDGDGPLAPLTWDAAGNLYGTMFFGGNGPPKCPGSLGCGVAFQMTPNGDGTWTYHLLHRFAAFPYDGRYPYAGLVVDAAGNAYGAASGGGPHGGGTIYKLTPTSKGFWKQTVLYDFPNCANGCGPNTSLVFDQAGNLYGTAGGGLTVCGGGGFYCGVVYKLTPQAGGTWKYSLLHKFNSADGAGANAIIIDGKGNLFGTTIAGGTYNFGVAFEITQ